MKNLGKTNYDEIPISEELDRAILYGMKRAEREKRRAVGEKWVGVAAAVFCVFFAGANIAPVYAYAAELPVVGAIVRVLHIGEGGTRTDGAHISADTQGETVALYFESNADALDAVPFYTAVHHLAPNRLVLTVQGVCTMDTQAVLASLLAADAVRDAYPSIIGDDSAYGFVIVLHRGYTYELTEYAKPAALSIRFYPEESDQAEATVYYLRTKAMPYGEELSLATEEFNQENATQLKTESGDYIVTAGQYATEAEADAALRELETRYGGDTGLFVAAGAADEVPEK
ncbi:DUF4179 domain-containing protein [Oscillibacter sp.]|uniref:DUF4179 domain-containing protein n=1 Tax=Oscillibacter sp. TaxID=1945593 RepID=UPI002624AF70|nr:DUF4179 domain-containing protein [Oscillibacter sp.]MDD3346674.1 DUF4179 domain-containing protein [Oscillibacter sp.]